MNGAALNARQSNGHYATQSHPILDDDTFAPEAKDAWRHHRRRRMRKRYGPKIAVVVFLAAVFGWVAEHI